MTNSRVGPEEAIRILQARSRRRPEKLPPVYPIWFWAVLKAQDDGDLKPLAALLRADDLLELRPVERELLAALFDNGRFRKGRGPRLGSMSADHRLKRAAALVKKKQADGLSRAAAIDAAVKVYPSLFRDDDAPGQKLANYMDGRRGSTQRRRKRALAKTK
jgi:hypothetical protein